MDLTLHLNAALESVRMATQVASRIQASIVTDDTLQKQDCSPVTTADFAVQALINDHLNDAFPTIPIIGEEDSQALLKNPTLCTRVLDELKKEDPSWDQERLSHSLDLGNATGGPEGLYWTLDPIDGTKGFIQQRHYAIALALLQDGHVVMGVLACPKLGPRGSIAFATQDGGAFLDHYPDSPTPLSVDTIQDPAQARFCESVEAGHTAQNTSAQVAKMLNITTPPYRLDSQAKYLALAQGEASIYLRLPTQSGYQEKIWDHAAGVIIVEEAGGKVTDITGKKLAFSWGRTLAHNQGVIASNGAFHETLIHAVQQTVQANPS